MCELTKTKSRSYTLKKGANMEYDDFSLPGQKEFEKLAKEYSKQISKDVSEKTLDDICYTLKFLQWLYEYIYKKLRIKRLKDVFFKLSGVCE